MKQETECELYGGPLDGLGIKVPVEFMASARVIGLPVNLNPESGYISIDCVSKEFKETTAIYVRQSNRTFKFKEIDDGTTELTTYDE